MPLNEIPKYLRSRHPPPVNDALEEAWQELNKDGVLDAHRTRMKLATTIVALACVGETDPPSSSEWQTRYQRGVATPLTNSASPPREPESKPLVGSLSKLGDRDNQLSNLSFLLNLFVGLLAIWAGSVLLCLALFPPIQNPLERERMSSMRAQTIPPPYETEKLRRH